MMFDNLIKSQSSLIAECATKLQSLHDKMYREKDLIELLDAMFDRRRNYGIKNNHKLGMHIIENYSFDHAKEWMFDILLNKISKYEKGYQSTIGMVLDKDEEFLWKSNAEFFLKKISWVK